MRRSALSGGIYAAHTAEHLFAGSLKRLKPGLKVVKVDQSEGKGSLYVDIPQLDWATILKAEEMANRVIAEGRPVKEHFFNSLEEAKNTFPQARAMDERISGRVRIVEVEGYDYAACIRGHVSNTRECEFFLVTRVSKAGGNRFQIDFLVGEEAKLRALELSKISLSVADILKAPIETVEKAVSNMKVELAELRRRLSKLSEREVKDIPSYSVGGVTVYSKVFEGLDSKRLMKRVGELTEEAGVVALLANIADNATVILARSLDLNVDCAHLLERALAEYGGRGGGRREFAFGSVGKAYVEEVFKTILASVRGSVAEKLI